MTANMIPPDLPAELKAALDARLEGLSRGDVAVRAAVISRTYRDGGTSSAIKSETDALAYALARMPATYAAVSACLNALSEARPDFAPQTLLDVGAGPGTASWATSEAFASLIPAFGRCDSILKSWRGRDSFLTYRIDSGGQRWAGRLVYERILGRPSCAGWRRGRRMPRRRDGCWHWRRFATG